MKGRASSLLLAVSWFALLGIGCERGQAGPPSVAELPDLELPGGGWLLQPPRGFEGRLTPRLAARLDRARATGTADGLRIGAYVPASLGRWSEARELLDRARRHGAEALVAADEAALALAAAADGDDPLGRVTALARSDEALLADPVSLLAWHNRALVLEQLELSASARAAWDRLVELAPADAPWLADAVAHRDLLRAESGPRSCWSDPDRWRAWLVSPTAHEEPALRPGRNAQVVRLFVEDELLPAWAGALLAGDVSRAQALADAALRLGQQLGAAGSDGMTLEVVKRALDAGAHGAQDLAAYGRGRASFHDLRWEDAARELETADRSLARARNPLDERARGYRAAALAQIGRAAEAEALLRALAQSPWPTVRGHANEQLGALYSRRSLPTEALRYFRESASIQARTGELASVAVLEIWMASTQHTLGDTERAWQAAERALDAADRSCNAYARAAAVWFAGDLLLRADALAAAATFQRESVALERAGGDPALVVESLRTLAMNEARLGQEERALASVADARGLLRNIPSRSVQRSQMAMLDWAEAVAVGRREPDRAVALLAAALPVLQGTPREPDIVALRLDLGRALLAAGRRPAGEEELRRGIDAYMTLRESLSSRDERARAFAHAEGAFDDLTLSLLTAGRLEEALLSSESGRRPVEAQRTSAAASASPAAGVAVLYLDQMDDRLAAWWIAEGGLKSWQVPWGRQHVRESVRELQEAAAAGEVGPLRSFSEDLLGPTLRDLGSRERLVVIVEDGLALLPWGALPHPRGGAWVDHLVLTVAHSLTNALAAPRHASRRRALVVADAVPDPQRPLPPLPAARAEAERIAELFATHDLLLGERATRAQVLGRWQDADVVHFSVHTQADATFARSARLVLSRSGDGSDGVAAADVAAATFDRRPLVVLSACATRSGRLVPLAGPMDLAREFLESGASGVVATLMPVDDRRAAELMVSFYRRLAANGDAAEALALAIRELPASHRAGAAGWSAFQYVGGEPSVASALPDSLTAALGGRRRTG